MKEGKEREGRKQAFLLLGTASLWLVDLCTELRDSFFMFLVKALLL